MEERINDVRQEMDSLGEDVEALLKAVGDSRSSTVHAPDGVSASSERPRERIRVRQSPRSVIRPAFAMDGASFATPEFQSFVYPGEEPPSIECNEVQSPARRTAMTAGRVPYRRGTDMTKLAYDGSQEW